MLCMLRKYKLGTVYSTSCRGEDQNRGRMYLTVSTSVNVEAPTSLTTISKSYKEKRWVY